MDRNVSMKFLYNFEKYWMFHCHRTYHGSSLAQGRDTSRHLGVRKSYFSSLSNFSLTFFGQSFWASFRQFFVSNFAFFRPGTPPSSNTLPTARAKVWLTFTVCHLSLNWLCLHHASNDNFKNKNKNVNWQNISKTVKPSKRWIFNLF